MKVIDTNILLRFFVDDPNDSESVKQKPIAQVILSKDCFIPLTVILEFEWVLRGFYKISKTQIVDIYKVLLNYEHIAIEDKQAVRNAVSLYQEGLDFADALHLSHTVTYQGFITFDEKFVKRGKKFGYAIQLADDFNNINI